MKLKYDIQQRRRILTRTGTAVSDGTHSHRWSEWSHFATATEDRIDHELTFWRELNLIATTARGPSAACEYRAVPSHTEINLNQPTFA